ncbi:MAG: hypothetical protein AB2A00_07665 [Myxococcota bacterium]
MSEAVDPAADVATQSIWLQDTPLSEMGLFQDWDYFASMVEFVRMMVVQHGVMPQWDFLICVGKPEMGNLQSWTWGWPLVLGLLFPPNWALMVLWLLLTTVGLCSAFALFRRWFHDVTAALTGTLLYALSGYFATHFHVGHVSFSFFHLVPLMMLCAEHLAEAELQGRAAPRWFWGAVVTSFAFFSAGLPHALLHFAPVMPLCFLARLWVLGPGAATRRLLDAAAWAVIPLALGAWMALYKVWPAFAWQLKAPRGGVAIETLDLAQVIGNTLVPVSGFPHDGGLGRFQGQAWYLWEYVGFMGPLPWVCALAALAAAGKGWRTWDRGQRAISVVGAVSLVMGVWLCLGNGHPLGIGRVFEHLPIVRSVRAFGRYQILVVFGLAVLSAQFLSLRRETMNATWRALTVLLLAGPLVGEAGVLVFNVEGQPFTQTRRIYELEGVAPVPELMVQRRLPSAYTDQQLLIRHGHAVANCSESMTLPRIDLGSKEPGTRAPLTFPPPLAVEEMNEDTLTLRVHNDRDLILNMPAHAHYEFTPAPAGQMGGHHVFAARDLAGGTLRIHASSPEIRQGALMALSGLLVTLVVALWNQRRQRISGPGTSADASPRMH